jgi:hypothetical protein
MKSIQVGTRSVLPPPGLSNADLEDMAAAQSRHRPALEALPTKVACRAPNSLIDWI